MLSLCILHDPRIAFQEIWLRGSRGRIILPKEALAKAWALEHGGRGKLNASFDLVH